MARSTTAVRDETAKQILEAAKLEFENVGPTRARMDDIARRAGVSRVTIYRRFETKEDLIRAVLADELARMRGELDGVLAVHADPEQRLVEGFAFAVEFARKNTLLQRVFETDPDLLRPAFSLGPSPSPVVETITHFLDHYHRRSPEYAAGRYDTRRLAYKHELIARMVVSLVINPGGVVDDSNPRELREFARMFLTPVQRAAQAA